MQTTKEWLAKWEKNRVKLKSPVDLNEYFQKDELYGVKLEHFTLGSVSIPSGAILVRDPLCYLDKKQLPYLQNVAKGEFPVTVCAVITDDDCARYAAIKVSFNENTAINFEEALIGNENLDEFEEGEYFGFNVDAGLAAILDVETRDAFDAFSTKWYKDNPDGNIYDDYFAALFEESYKQQPRYQREGGDWLNWTVPGTQLKIPIFQSGFGDGTYPVYFGYDDEGNVCSLIVNTIDIELAYSEENE